MRKTILALCVVSLSGCASFTDVFKNQNKLYGPAPLNTVSTSTAMGLYNTTLAAVQAGYANSLVNAPPDQQVAALIEAGIGAANANCRAWFALTSDAERKFTQGRGNVGILENAITAVLGLTQASSTLVSAYGIGAAGYEAYTNNFEASVLSIGHPDIQASLRSLMDSSAANLRASESTMTFPQAIDALDAYAALCSYQMARAVTSTALNGVNVSVSRTGALTATRK